MEVWIDRLVYYILGTITSCGLGGAILGFRIHMSRRGEFDTFDVILGAALLCAGLYYAVMTVLEFRYRYGGKKARRRKRRR